VQKRRKIVCRNLIVILQVQSWTGRGTSLSAYKTIEQYRYNHTQSFSLLITSPLPLCPWTLKSSPSTSISDPLQLSCNQMWDRVVQPSVPSNILIALFIQEQPMASSWGLATFTKEESELTLSHHHLDHHVHQGMGR